jgi:hypothetical protein
MSLFVAAIGATVTAIVELTVGPYIRVGNAQPHLVFVFAVVWTIAIGLESGSSGPSWAASPSTSWPSGRSEHRPSHSSSSSVSRRRSLAYSSGFRPIVVVPAVAILSLVYSMTSFFLLGALGSSAAAHDPIGTLCPASAYDTVVAALVGPLAVAVHDRYVEEERVDW